MPCMALAKLTVRPTPRRTKSKVETFLISSGENHRLTAATHVEVRAVAVAVLAPAHCHATPWLLATWQRLHGYVCWSPQKKCSTPRNAHQSGSTARRPHTTFWWAWNPRCNFLPQEGAACLRRTRGPNTGSHQPCKPQPHVPAADAANTPHTSLMYLTHVKACGRRSCSAAHAITHLAPGPPQGRLQCMRVVVQLLGRWPMHGLAGESKCGSFTDQKMLSGSQAENQGDLSKTARFANLLILLTNK